MTIGFSKLKSGDWGLRGTGEAPMPGEVVLVTKRSGKESQETVGAVVWAGEDTFNDGGPAWLATIFKEGDPTPQARPAERDKSGNPVGDSFPKDSTPF